MSDSSLTSPDVVIVLAQALTGLGHLRVTHALYHGLPHGAHALMLSSQDTSVNYVHKITSINPWLRSVMEFTQQGWFEDAFAKIARSYYRGNTKLLEEQLQTILEQHITRPKTLLVVATHMLIGHQLAAIKESFSKKYHVHLIVAIVVTDDSPQHIWAVGGADLIFVPSEYTKHQLEIYHKSQKELLPATYVVTPYMVSPRLGAELTEAQMKRRKQQLHSGGLAAIQMAIPVSGAAVQLQYYEKLIRYLYQMSDRFEFHVVSKQSPSTVDFLAHMIGQPHIKLHVSSSHREVVDLYEKLYEKEVIALEVTKPSEQTFKALLKPQTRGGSILLFSEPVGRQEWDNLRFLLRHGLLPTKEEHEHLWRLALKNKPVEEAHLVRARLWRGIRLPPHSKASARFIWWCYTQGIFSRMMRFPGFHTHTELGGNGVEKFWQAMESYLKDHAEEPST